MKKALASSNKAKLDRTEPLRLGIYGGTFDPIHYGHLILAQDALEQLKLDLILFVPCAQSPHKMDRLPTPPELRVEMITGAIQSFPHFWLSRSEMERKAPSFAIDTVHELKTTFASADLFWLIGEDQLEKLSTWHRYEELKKEIKFVVLARSGFSQSNPPDVISLPRPRRIDISGSEIRARVKSGLPIDHLVPPSVAAIIQKNKLYR